MDKRTINGFSNYRIWEDGKIENNVRPRLGEKHGIKGGRIHRRKRLI